MIFFIPDCLSASAIRLNTPLGFTPAPLLPRSAVVFSPLLLVSRLIFSFLFLLAFSERMPYESPKWAAIRPSRPVGGAAVPSSSAFVSSRLSRFSFSNHDAKYLLAAEDESQALGAAEQKVGGKKPYLFKGDVGLTVVEIFDSERLGRLVDTYRS